MCVIVSAIHYFSLIQKRSSRLEEGIITSSKTSFGYISARGSFTPPPLGNADWAVKLARQMKT